MNYHKAMVILLSPFTEQKAELVYTHTGVHCLSGLYVFQLSAL